jgi:hypothetical protein
MKWSTMSAFLSSMAKKCLVIDLDPVASEKIDDKEKGLILARYCVDDVR